MIVRLDPADLVASLAAAQADLAASDAGTEHEWIMPAPPDGDAIVVPAAVVIDAGDRSLLVHGVGGTPRLRIAAGGADDGLAIGGNEVALRNLAVEVEGAGLRGVLIDGELSASLTACSVSARGQAVVAAHVRSRGLAEAVDVDVTEARATAGDAVGLAAEGGTVRLHRVRVSDVVAAQDAIGLRGGQSDGSGIDVQAVTASALTIARVTGDAATGALVRSGAIDQADDASVGPAAQSLVLLDLDVTDVRARAVGETARGIAVTGEGDLDLRGVSISDVEGDTAAGATVLAGGEMRVSGGLIRSVAGGAGGAVGLRLAASASPGAIEVGEVQVEAVHAVDRADVVFGVDVRAPVSELAPWVDDATPPGVVRLTGCVLRRISGTALNIDADLRDVLVRDIEVYTAARAGVLRGERVIISETTWHRLQRGLSFGPCSLTLVSSLITGVADAPTVELGAETETTFVRAVYAEPADPVPLLRALPGGSPYVDPGPAGVPAALAEGRALPPSEVDLRLGPGAALHDEAVATPGDPPEQQPHLGAHPPRTPAVCDLRDPLELPPDEATPVPGPGPVVDRLARDGRGLLGVMQARANAALPGWVPGDSADITTTMFELVAHQLDRVSYRQDFTLAEASLAGARLRRSVEAHAGLVDYRPDPGLSATTMIELHIPPESFVALGLAAEVDGVASAHVGPFTLAADSVVVNRDGTEAPVIASTEHDLLWHDSLADVELADDVAQGDVHVVLRGDLVDLTPERWLVLQPDDTRQSPHVVRATVVERGADTTLVYWDPRRPAPIDYPAACPVLANVVPAHHGLRVGHRFEPAMVEGDLREEVQALASALDLHVETDPDAPVELALPIAAASRVAPGWPFDDRTDRIGELDVAIEVDDEEWRLVDDVAVESGEVFAVVPAVDGGSVLRLGQPGSFSGVPAHVTVTTARVGIGRDGNVAAHTLTSLLALGSGSTVPPDEMSMSDLRTLLSVDNPVAGSGGRDPEPLERIRRAAPWTARRPATAVTTTDYETLLTELPEVAGARARVQELGERRLVQVTMLLADEDTLVPRSATEDRGSVELYHDAERLRRWGLARRRLEEIRLLGFDVMLVPPTFVPLDLDLVVDAHDWASAEVVQKQVTEAVAGNGGLLDPDIVGLGGDVHVDGIMRSALAVDGVAAARVRRLRRLEPGATEHAVDGTFPVGAEEVAIIRRPYGDGTDGLLTVEVCGGVR